MEVFYKIIREFDDLLAMEVKRRSEEGSAPIGRPEIRILGQISLLLDPGLVKNVLLAATIDVDAIFKGTISAQELFRKALSKNALVYDELSSEIWIPEGVIFEPVHDSEYSSIARIDTFSALIAKAAKAPEKNKFLIKSALEYYGTALMNKFKEHGVNLEFLERGKKKE